MRDLTEQTEEPGILREHTEEFLAPLSDTSGTGHPQSHQNVQTEAWLVLQHCHVPFSQLFHLPDKPLWSSQSTDPDPS